MVLNTVDRKHHFTSFSDKKQIANISYIFKVKQYTNNLDLKLMTERNV